MLSILLIGCLIPLTIMNKLFSSSVCQTKLDLVFVIDGSGSVGVHNFIKVKEFLKNVVDFYNVGLDQTRIGLITYSYRVSVNERKRFEKFPYHYSISLLLCFFKYLIYCIP